MTELRQIKIDFAVHRVMTFRECNNIAAPHNIWRKKADRSRVAAAIRRGLTVHCAGEFSLV
jgi:hypothetical protein